MSTPTPEQQLADMTDQFFKVSADLQAALAALGVKDAALRDLTGYIDREGPPAKEWGALTESNEKAKSALSLTPAAAKNVIEESEPARVREDDDCPTEGAVLKREWREQKATIVEQARTIEQLRGENATFRTAFRVNEEQCEHLTGCVTTLEDNLAAANRELEGVRKANADLDFIVSAADRATEGECDCGGLPGEDKNACPACRVYSCIQEAKKQRAAQTQGGKGT